MQHQQRRDHVVGQRDAEQAQAADPAVARTAWLARRGDAQRPALREEAQTTRGGQPRGDARVEPDGRVEVVTGSLAEAELNKRLQALTGS